MTKKGKVLNNQFRSYKVTHYGQQPEYKVEFIETPHDDSPFGSRALGEHGILGMPAALANCLSVAAQVSFASVTDYSRTNLANETEKGESFIMIPFDFEYYRPNSITEALQLYSKLYQEGKNADILQRWN